MDLVVLVVVLHLVWALVLARSRFLVIGGCGGACLLFCLVSARTNRTRINYFGRNLDARDNVAILVQQRIAHFDRNCRIIGFNLEDCLVLVVLVDSDWTARAYGRFAGICSLFGKLQLAATDDALNHFAQRGGVRFCNEIGLDGDVGAQVYVANASVARTRSYSNVLDVLRATIGEINLDWRNDGRLVEQRCNN